MKKSPEGENPEELGSGQQETDELREDLRRQGLTDSQIDEMMIRLNLDQSLDPNRPRPEPEFLYEVYEEKLGRPLMDLEKTGIKAALDEEWNNRKAHFGVDKDGKIKES